MSLIQSGIQDINVFYQGFTNEGLKPTYFGQTAFDRATGSRRDFSTLIAQMKASNVQVYPEILMNQAYTDQSIRVNEDVIRDVFSNVVKNYAFNPATMYVNPSARPVYTLHTSTYSKTTNAILRLTSSLGNKNIAFGDAGTQSYGSYLKKDVFFRNDQQMAIQAVLTSLQDQSIQMMFRNPRMFALSYAKVVTDIPMQSTDYQIISRSVPFYPLVLSGYIDYSGQSANIADFYPFEWHVLKAMETASNLSITWSYASTISLVDTEYSYYYSTYFAPWFDKVVDVMNQLKDSGIYQTHLVAHELLSMDGLISKSTYANGLEIIFNYRLVDVVVAGHEVPKLGYLVIKGAN